MNNDDKKNLAHGHILVASDDGSTLSFLTELLIQNGYQVQPTGNAKNTLHKAQADLPELILLIANRTGKTALDLCRQLKDDPASKHIPIIISCNPTAAELKVAALQAGAIGCIANPIDPPELLTKIDTHLKIFRLQKQLAVQSDNLRQALQREQVMADIVRNAPMAIAHGYPDGSLAHCNSAFSDMTGYTIEELQAISWNKTLTPAKWRTEETEHLARLSPENPSVRYEKEYLHKNGAIIQVELFVTATYDSENKLVNFVGFITDISKRKQVEKKINRVSQLLDDSLNEVYILDSETLRFIDVNRAACINLGYSLEELQEMTPMDVNSSITPKHFAELTAPLRSGAKKKVVFTTDRHRKNGTVYPVEVHLQLMPEEQPVFVAITMDISERQQVEQKYQELVEGSSDLIIQIDKTGDILFVNRMATEIFGSAPAQIIGKPAFQFLHPDDREMTGAWYENCLKNKVLQSRIEDRQVNLATGAVHDILWTSNFHYDEQGQFLYSMGIGHDITERKQYETAIHRNEAQWDRTFHSFTDLVTIQNTSMEIVKANKAAAAHLDLPHESIAGIHCYELFLGQEVPCLDCPLLHSKTSFTPYRQEMVHPQTNRTFLVSATPVLDEHGALEYVAHVAKDITACKQMENQLFLSEKMKSIAGLAAGVAHEINTPLSAILQSAQVMEMGLEPDSPSNRKCSKRHGIDLHALQAYFKEQQFDFFMDGIKSSAINAAEIIKSLVNFSRPQEGHFAPWNLNVVMEQAVAMARTDYDLKKKYDSMNVTIIEEYDTDLPAINCVGMEIEQVALNLITNSIQAMSTEEQKGKPCLILRTVSDSRKAFIEVEDNGPGIDEEARQHIFDPFYTTREVGAGTGLGLSLARTIIVEKHKGEIRVESNPGKGTKFTIDLPLNLNPSH